jgi:hypothetical protein
MAAAKKPDVEHLRWAVNQRAEIQRTLLALYEYVRKTPSKTGYAEPRVYLLDNLIGAAFSLWRAVFLAEIYRTDETIHQSQEAFLAKVISDNSITFGTIRSIEHGPSDIIWTMPSSGLNAPHHTLTIT